MALSSSINKPHWMKRALVVSLSLVVLNGCQMMPDFSSSQSTTAVEIAVQTSATRTCEDPRPKICTMRYEPVCAVMATGRITTYPSACNACADIAVSGWRPDPCEDL